MFHFEKNGMYQMPYILAHAAGQGAGRTVNVFTKKGRRKVRSTILVYETAPEAVKKYLPEGFILRLPYVIVTHKMHRKLPWLARARIQCDNL